LEALAEEDEPEAMPTFGVPSATAPAAEAPLHDQEELPAGEPDALPDWLAGLVPAEDAEVAAPVPAPAADDASLDWLTEEADVDVAPDDIAAWLRAQEEAPLAVAEVEEDLEEDLSWLEDIAAEEAPEVAEPAPAPAPTPPAPEPVLPAPPPVEPQPAPPQPAVAAAPVMGTKQLSPADLPEEAPPPPFRVAATIDEASGWLKQARQFKEAGEVEECLVEYERIMRSEHFLEETAHDLEDIARQLATHVRVRRILGDVYMRQNRLQEALDTYRGALDQI
jgi:hypothetical protein